MFSTTVMNPLRFDLGTPSNNFLQSRKASQQHTNSTSPYTQTSPLVQHRIRRIHNTHHTDFPFFHGCRNSQEKAYIYSANLTYRPVRRNRRIRTDGHQEYTWDGNRQINMLFFMRSYHFAMSVHTLYLRPLLPPEFLSKLYSGCLSLNLPMSSSSSSMSKRRTLAGENADPLGGLLGDGAAHSDLLPA